MRCLSVSWLTFAISFSVREQCLAALHAFTSVQAGAVRLPWTLKSFLWASVEAAWELSAACGAETLTQAGVCTKQLEEDLVVEGWREGEGDSKCISRAPLDWGQSSRPGVAPQRWGGLCCLCRLSLRKAICFQEAPQWETFLFFIFLYICLHFFFLQGVRERERERKEGRENKLTREV